MVAGAYKAELLSDFRGAVDKAITQGTTLAEFRKDFDRIVATNGWSYNGTRNWRSELIYSTNIRTAYAAGRWEQLQDPVVQEACPYLEYRHGNSLHPRPQHLAWHGLILPRDDPFWQTHYPPNGWGCKCKVFAATKRDQRKAQASGKTNAPPSPIDQKTGEPEGIDKGWGYNVGEAAQKNDYRVLSDKFETLPDDIGRKWMRSFLESPTFERFHTGKIKGDFPVAVLNESERQVLGSKTQTVWLSDETMKKIRDVHPDISLADCGKIPEIIDAGEVYQQADERLIYLKENEKLYRLGLKNTKDKKSNFMLTLFSTSTDKAKKQVLEKYKRIR